MLAWQLPRAVEALSLAVHSMAAATMEMHSQWLWSELLLSSFGPELLATFAAAAEMVAARLQLSPAQVVQLASKELELASVPLAAAVIDSVYL